MKYFDELKRAMTWLGTRPDTIFMGQAVAYPGTGMTNTLKDVDPKKLYELPCIEDFQLGVSIGYALNGSIPISIFPRWNFLLLATNQLVNHLDKIKEYSHNEFIPKVIIRTAIGSKRPLHPQIQHVGDYTEAFKLMLQNVELIRLEEHDQIFNAYKHAYERDDHKSTVLVEYSDYYNEK